MFGSAAAKYWRHPSWKWLGCESGCSDPALAATALLHCHCTGSRSASCDVIWAAVQVSSAVGLTYHACYYIGNMWICMFVWFFFHPVHSISCISYKVLHILHSLTMTLVPVISMILSGCSRDKLGHKPRISGSQLLLPCIDQCCLKTLHCWTFI